MGEIVPHMRRVNQGDQNVYVQQISGHWSSSRS
jgi:hypothetical protein